jgi:beta-phosphoglucomutase family hydrolase
MWSMDGGSIPKSVMFHDCRTQFSGPRAQDKNMSLKPIIKAMIFDMDGVISDTQGIHAKTESELLKSYGIAMHADEITRRYAGVGDEEMFREIFSRAQKEIPEIKRLVETKWRIMDELVRGNVKEIPGTREFIERLENLGLPLAVGSASRLAFMELVLAELGLRNRFCVIASAEEVEKGKPEPDLFLLVANRLSVEPENCVVIEDAVSGMIAAKRAKMQCIGLVRDQNEQNYPADLIVTDLRKVPINKYI